MAHGYSAYNRNGFVGRIRRLRLTDAAYWTYACFIIKALGDNLRTLPNLRGLNSEWNGCADVCGKDRRRAELTLSRGREFCNVGGQAAFGLPVPFSGNSMAIMAPGPRTSQSHGAFPLSPSGHRAFAKRIRLLR